VFIVHTLKGLLNGELHHAAVLIVEGLGIGDLR
jgi:hypothetical protein